MAFKLRSMEQISLGVLLAAIATAAIIWLGYSRNLNYYISPIYDGFAVIMAVLSFTAIAGSTFFVKHAQIKSFTIKKSVVASGVLACLLGLCFLILQPKALSSSIAQQRGINAGGLDLTTTTNGTGFGATNYSQFDIRDWASVLSQTSQISFYNGKTANLLGFVSPSPDDNPDVFYVSRFYITCCAIDAQPYGVPISAANYKASYPVNSWVAVSGNFKQNLASNSKEPIVLQPTKMSSVPEPKDPYVR